MVIGYANKSFIDLMNWLYVRYGQITPGDHMWDQEYMEAKYNVEDSIDILFD